MDALDNEGIQRNTVLPRSLPFRGDNRSRRVVCKRFEGCRSVTNVQKVALVTHRR